MVNRPSASNCLISIRVFGRPSKDTEGHRSARLYDYWGKETGNQLLPQRVDRTRCDSDRRALRIGSGRRHSAVYSGCYFGEMSHASPLWPSDVEVRPPSARNG